MNEINRTIDSFTASRVLHAGYLFQAAGESILMDPILETPFSHNCYAYPAVQFFEDEIEKLQVDAVFISHVHDDHLCFKSLNRLSRKTPIYLYAEEPIYFEMLKSLGFNNVFGLKLDQKVCIGQHFQVTPRLALDPQVDSLFQIQIGDFNILNVVDSWVDPQALKQMQDVKKWDLILWPFQTMREIQVLSPNRASREKEIPAEWGEVLRQLNPRFVVPSSCQFRHESWSWYNEALFPIQYSDFKEWLAQILPQAQYLRIDPSKGFFFSKEAIQSSPDLKILKCLEEGEVDYHYDENHQAPPVGLIAENLPVLSGEDLRWVLNYCQKELVQELTDKAQTLDCLLDYCCVWKLVLHGSAEKAYSFTYDIQGDAVELLTQENANQVEPTWLTEIPAQKLWSSLKSGETLTSLYLRINDMTFSSEVECGLEELDLMEDPLIRVLFDGKVFRYHKQQLAELGL